MRIVELLVTVNNIKIFIAAKKYINGEPMSVATKNVGYLSFHVKCLVFLPDFNTI